MSVKVSRLSAEASSLKSFSILTLFSTFCNPSEENQDKEALEEIDRYI
jgi:hypothetical protein